MSSPWRKFASVSSNLKNIAIRICPPTLLELYVNHTTQSIEVPPLNFPVLPDRLPLLLGLGASVDYAQLLYAQFLNAAQNVDATLFKHYYTNAPKLWDSRVCAVGSRSTYIQANQNHLILLRTRTIERLWNALYSRAQTLFNETGPTQDSPRTGSAASPMINAPSSKRKRQGRPSPFTAEQTFALNALFVRDDQYSAEDKDFIAQNLNLTRDQVNRWFCNARARKKSSSAIPLRCESPDSIRTVSSDLTIISAESHQTELSSMAEAPAQNHLLQCATAYDVTNSTPGFNDPNHPFTLPTPGCTPELTNSTQGLDNASTRLTNQALEVDSLDAYLSYSAYLEPEQTPGDLTHNFAAQQDHSSFTTHITNWSERVSESAPVLSSTSSLDCQVAATSVPTNPSLDPEAQQSSCDVASFNDPVFDTLNLSSIQPLPPFPSSVPEYPQSSDLFPDGFDLSQW